MSEQPKFKIPTNPGVAPSHTDFDNIEDYDVAHAEWREAWGEYAEWAPRNTPDSYQKVIDAVRKIIPAKNSESVQNPTAFVTSMLALLTLIIEQINNIVTDVEFSLERVVKSEKKGGWKPFSQRITSKKKYDTKRHSNSHHFGVEMSADIYSDGKGGKYAFVSDSGELSFLLSTDHVEQLRELSPAILNLGKTAVNKEGRKAIEDNDRVAFTWSRVHGSRGTNYVERFVDNSAYNKFHEERNKVYRHRLQAGDSIDDAGDFAESKTEEIMKRMELL